jgi:hypothetical protein
VALLLSISERVAWSGANSNDRKEHGLLYLSLLYGFQGDHEPGKEPGEIIILFLSLIILLSVWRFCLVLAGKRVEPFPVIEKRVAFFIYASSMVCRVTTSRGRSLVKL